MAKLTLVLIVLFAIDVTVSSKFSDSCDFDNPELKKLCRKVESQDQYLAKMVDNFYKSDTVFKWYTANKDWVTHPRLGRMIKRLLRRVTGDSSDATSDDVTAPAPSETAATNSADSDAKFQQLTKSLENLELLFNETRTKVASLEKSALDSATKSDLASLVEKINSTLKVSLELMASEATKTNLTVGESLKRIATLQDSKILQLENRVKNASQCSCSSAVTSSSQGVMVREETGAKLESLEAELLSVKRLFESGARETEGKLLATSDDLMKAMQLAKAANEETMRNFSQNFDKVVNSLNSFFAERYSDNGGFNTYEMIINMTTVFNEDMQMVRNLVSNSTRDVQYLLSQDVKVQRGLEELRTASRRQEGNIQTINNQVNEFRNHVQDQMTTIRTSFIQSVNEFYTKLVERQNHMSYRLTAIIDDVQAIKTKVRAGKLGDEQVPLSEEEDLPSLPPLPIN